MSDRHILDLARAAGLAPEWTDAFGKPQQVKPDGLRAILEALGFPCGSEEQARDSQARLAQQESDMVPPLITAEVGQPVALGALRTLAGQSYRIELEDGGQLDGRIADDAGHGIT
ncbi:4-alpha-glucanotransferase, partial [Oxalobacteraceae bacterium OM1]